MSAVGPSDSYTKADPGATNAPSGEALTDSVNEIPPPAPAPLQGTGPENLYNFELEDVEKPTRGPPQKNPSSKARNPQRNTT